MSFNSIDLERVENSSLAAHNYSPLIVLCGWMINRKESETIVDAKHSFPSNRRILSKHQMANE